MSWWRTKNCNGMSPAWFLGRGENWYAVSRTHLNVACMVQDFVGCRTVAACMVQDFGGCRTVAAYPLATRNHVRAVFSNIIFGGK